MRVVSFEDYVNLARPQNHWIIQNLIPYPGTALLLGEPKSGKTYFALQMALAVTQGKQVLGRDTKPSDVLYLNLDMSETETQDRGHTLAKVGVNIATSRLKLIHPDDMMRPLNVLSYQGFAWLKAAVEDADPQLVVIDVLREIHLEDENDSTAMKRVFDALERAVGQRSMLCLHHTKKLPPDLVTDPDPIYASRGSGYLTGKAHSFWLLYGERLCLVSRSDARRWVNCKRQADGHWSIP